MQNIFAARSEGITTYNTYKGIGLLDNNYNFIIPVYENMPLALSKEPENLNTQTNLNEKVQLTGDNVLLRSEPTTSGNILAKLKKHTIAIRIEKNSNYSNGYYWDKIKLSDGTVGYIVTNYLSTKIIETTINTEKVKIRYVYDKKEITLDVCYLEDAVFSKERDRFDYEDKTYQRFTSDFISSLRDGKFVRYIKEAKNEGGNILYPELMEAINEFTYGGREVDLSPIRKALTSYKQARDVYFLTKKYREKEFVNRHEANPYSSDEEEMSYQTYLENLPGDYEEEKHERIKTPIKKMNHEK